MASRQTSKSTFPSHVVVQKTDYTEPSLVEIFKGKDAVVSALGGGLGEQKKIVDAAEKAGVKRFLSSEYGCNTRNEEILQLAPVWRRKRDMIRYLGERAGENVDFSWTALVTVGSQYAVGWTSLMALLNRDYSSMAVSRMAFLASTPLPKLQLFSIQAIQPSQQPTSTPSAKQLSAS